MARVDIMNVKMTLIALIFMPIVAGYSMFFYSKISRRFRIADEAEGELMTDHNVLVLEAGVKN